MYSYRMYVHASRMLWFRVACSGFRLTESIIPCVCSLHSSVQILGVLELLVKYGYYDDPVDIKTLLEPFLSMLRGENDKPGAGKCPWDVFYLSCSAYTAMMYLYPLFTYVTS